MASLPHDRARSGIKDLADQSVQPHDESQPEVSIDAEQMFQLIDGILPFEACLYHQVLPLSVEGSRLKLGMVNLKDTAALDYVRRMMAYVNCSLMPQAISADTHHAMLSSYLSYSAKKKASSPTANRLNRGADQPSPQQKSHKPDPDTQATFVVDSPEELSVLEETATPPPTAPSSAPKRTVTPATIPTPEKIAPRVPQCPNSLPALDLQTHYLSSPVEALAGLPPKKLLQELLARVLLGGIGRLYFERQQQQGRVLWSQNGVLQSVLEGLDPTVLQGLINELKLLTSLSLLPVQNAKQVEIERIYKQNRLLLRLRIMPGPHGEEATLQVLRGAALKFYQQQQLTKLSRDALGIAQQLQHKVNEIRERAYSDAVLGGSEIDALPALNQLLQYMDQQLKELEALQVDNQSAG